MRTLASGIGYLPFGPLKTLTYGNGLSLARSFDGNYWLGGITLSNGTSNLLALSVTRDANGQVMAISDAAAAERNASYTYTPSGRLESAVGEWGADAYTWDANGNRTRVDRTIASTTVSDVAAIAAGSNRLTQVADGGGTVARAFTYTPDGNIATSLDHTTGKTSQLAYVARGRLDTVSVDTIPKVSYAYDWTEQRVAAQTAGGLRHYIFDPLGRLLAEHDGASGAVVREYVWLEDSLLAYVHHTGASAGTYYVTTGTLAEPLIVSDASGQVVSSVAHDPWGNSFAIVGDTVLDLSFPGQWSDPATGLAQNWQRYSARRGKISLAT